MKSKLFSYRIGGKNIEVDKRFSMLHTGASHNRGYWPPVVSGVQQGTVPVPLFLLLLEYSEGPIRHIH